MPIFRYPVLLIQDHNELWTAMISGDVNLPVAVDKTARKALGQLREAMTRMIRNDIYVFEPSMSQAELVHVEVSIRPEYTVGHRAYPFTSTIPLKVPCVRGDDVDGNGYVCHIPMFGIEFSYYKQGGLRKLVKHYVAEALNGLTPEELTPYFPFRDVQVEEMAVTINDRESKSRKGDIHPTLTETAMPLSDPAVRKLYSRALERESEIAEVVRRLQEEKSSLLIVGAPGVGKTSILVDACRKVEMSTRSESGVDRQRQFWQTSGSRIIAGMKFLGQWEERCENMIQELSTIRGVLCLDGLVDTLRAASTEVRESVAAFLLPFIRYGELRVICEATPEAVTACEQLFPEFLEPFQIVRIEPFTRDQAVHVLHRTAEALTQNAKITFEDGLLERIYDLFARFLPYDSFPGRVIAFVRKIWDQALIANRDVTREEVLLHFMEDTGLNEIFLRDEQPLAHDDVCAWFCDRVIGQPSACDAAAGLVTVFKAALNDPRRPIGVLFFCGPTGVGKTALALAISRYFFGAGDDQAGLIRLDMSEYGTPGAVDRLLGQSSREASDFINRIRRKPFSVILLDEIEKADPEIFDLLLNVLDEGRLVDRFGRQTSFRSAIIIMTSNVGAANTASIGFDGKSEQPGEADVMKFFRPEFFNRIDQVVPFNALDRESIEAITRKELRDLSEREGLTRRKIRLDWSDDVVRHLASQGFDPRWGARQLLRTIEDQVVNPLAAFLLKQPDARKLRLRAELHADCVEFKTVDNG